MCDKEIYGGAARRFQEGSNIHECLLRCCDLLYMASITEMLQGQYGHLHPYASTADPIGSSQRQVGKERTEEGVEREAEEEVQNDVAAKPLGIASYELEKMR
ncbi:hypothetical protein VNO80_03257 [Phaseolus coccineus]|uniref:Uncharacterized protein n=1 Tax=Phaseolus coccineus TaxID=3886 RepID=A0AAN9RMX4_PHACN